MRRILILVASTGAGHKVAGMSIGDLIDEIKGERPLIEDVLKEGKFPYSISDKIYYFLADFPFLWKFFYYFSNDEKYDRFLKIQNYFLRDSLKRKIEEYNPSIIFCTHSFYVPVLKEFKKTKNFKVISIITDFGEIHRAWLSEGFDILWIPSEFSKRELEKNFGLKENYVVLGYPVRKGFWNIENKGKEYVLIMGGGRGAGPLKKIFNNIYKLEIKQIYICGTNERLKNWLTLIKKKKGLKHIEIIGFTDEIYNFMKDAICVISKPGGSTVAECNFLEKPLIGINPLPGQEEGNAKFIENTGSGIVIRNLKELRKVLEKIINGDIKFEFKEKMKDYINKQIEFIKGLL